MALSDPLRLTARALTTLRHRDWEADARAIRALVEQHEVTEVVVGHPIRLGGQRGRAALAAERAVERLRRALRVPVRLWDERWTTVAARRTLVEMNLSRRRRGAAVDKMAAALILEGFLEFDRRERGGAQSGGAHDGEE